MLVIRREQLCSPELSPRRLLYAANLLAVIVTLYQHRVVTAVVRPMTPFKPQQPLLRVNPGDANPGYLTPPPPYNTKRKSEASVAQLMHGSSRSVDLQQLAQRPTIDVYHS